MKFYFDMDGTLNKFYDQKDWLNAVENEKVWPYLRAKPMISMNALARKLNALQRAGHEIGIISWTSKGASEDFHEKIIDAKRKWLEKHLPSVVWDEIHIYPYGVNKSSKRKNSILFDDDINVRNDWEMAGMKSYSEKEIFKILKKFC